MLGEPDAVVRDVEVEARGVHDTRRVGEDDGPSAPGADTRRGLAVGGHMHVMAAHSVQAFARDTLDALLHRLRGRTKLNA